MLFLPQAEHHQALSPCFCYQSRVLGPDRDRNRARPLSQRRWQGFPRARASAEGRPRTNREWLGWRPHQPGGPASGVEVPTNSARSGSTWVRYVNKGQKSASSLAQLLGAFGSCFSGLWRLCWFFACPLGMAAAVGFKSGLSIGPHPGSAL